MPTVSGGVNGEIFTVVVTDGNSCTQSSTTALVVNALPALTSTGTSCSADFSTYTITFTSDGTVTSSAGTVTSYYPAKGMTLTSTGFGGMAYGGVNIANDTTKEVDWIAAEFYAKAGEKTSNSDDNPEYKDIFKSAPAVIIPDGSQIAIATVTTA